MNDLIENVEKKDELVWDKDSKRFEKRTNFIVNLKSPFREIFLVIGVILGLLLIGWMFLMSK
jgi:hypothetical protein